MKKMKTWILLIVLLLLGNTAQAADITFSWLPNEENVEGYKIYYGTESRNYTKVVDVGNPEPIGDRIIHTVTGIPLGVTYYYAATAYNIDEESDYSTEVEYRHPYPKPGAPQMFEVNVSISVNVVQ